MGSQIRSTQHGTLTAVDEFFRQHGFFRTPRLVQWMVTQRCALKCPHCLTAAAGPSPEMSVSEACHFLDDVATLGIDELLLTGGEPLTREDLGDIVSELRARGQRWSLNTARMPSQSLRRALEAWPPSFVAVSLDGPATIHDDFRGGAGLWREASAAIRYFSDLAPAGVAAGTTVTATSFSYLARTFTEVVESGASYWGLHLVIPEGRAARRPDLLLSRSQLRELIAFVATKRRYFPVILADEIGFVGTHEPFVRDTPFFCGAGRAQCVVLPDGEVVPCTTVDRSTSAGNVLSRSLAEIWARGFADLRRRGPEKECRSCVFAPACGGGCWLQRRHGIHCALDLWQPSPAHRAKALALCMGLTAACAPLVSQSPSNEASSKEVSTSTAPAEGSALTVSNGGPVDPPSNEPNAGPTPSISDRVTTRTSAGAATAASCMPPRGTSEEGSQPGLSASNLAQPRCEMEIVQRAILHWYLKPLGTGRWVPEAVDPIQTLETALPNDPAAKYVRAFMQQPRSATLATRSEQITQALSTTQRSLCLVGLAWRDLTEWCLDSAGPQKRSQTERAQLRTTLGRLAKTAEVWRQDIFAEKLDRFLRQPSAYRWFFMSKAGPPPSVTVEKRLANKRGWTNPQLSAAFLAEHPFAELMTLRLTPRDHAAMDVWRDGSWVRFDNQLGVFDILRVTTKGDCPVEIESGSQVFTVRLPTGAEISYGDVLQLFTEQQTASAQELTRGVTRPGQIHTALSLTLPTLRSEKARLSVLKTDEAKRRLRWVIWWLTDIYLF